MISFLVGFLLLGGLYDWSITITGICIIVEILLLYKKKKTIYKNECNYILWIPVIVFVWIIAVSLWAVDYAGNLLGILRGAMLLFWMYLCFQMEEEEKKKIFVAIPYMGAGMTVVGILSLVHEDWMACFWQARRLGGFFQYANTCALFLTVGLMLLIQQMIQKQNNPVKKKTVAITGRFDKQYITQRIVLCLLIIGIFLTGSRSVLLFFLMWGIYKTFKVKRLRRPFLVTAVLCLAVAAGYGILSGDNQNIARIFTLFQSNSTIYGRLLYDIDALSIAVENPFGLGYMGYYYVQPAVQSGVYITRFVHNDLLQLLVDYGFLTLILALIYVVYQLLKGKQETLKKELMVFILLASLVDFHLQYMNVFMILILCFDFGERKKVKISSKLHGKKVVLGMAIAVFSYFTIAFGSHYLGNDDLALTFFPDYTAAQVQKLNTCTDMEKAELLTDAILSHNQYVSDAYNTKVYIAAMKGDWLRAMEYMDHTIALRRYDVITYQTYEGVLTDMIASCEEMGKVEDAEKLAEYKSQLPQKLASVETQTHPIAYKLRDLPQFTW